MPIEMDREGVFRGKIVEYELKEFESGAACIALTCTTDDIWDADGQAWVPWGEYDMQAKGDIFILGKEGKVMDRAIRDLNKHAGWDGDLTKVVSGEWNPTPISFSIKLEENAKFGDKFRIGFLNAYDRIPGGQFTCDPEAARALANKYGSKLRALCSETAKAPVPATKPAAPKAKPKPPAKPVEAPPPSDDIPF